MKTTRKRSSDWVCHTVRVQPFDINLHVTQNGEGLMALQNRFAMWLRGLSDSARFVTWQMPADLRPRISETAQKATIAHQHHDTIRFQLLMESRRYYEQLQNEAQYQRSICGFAQWNESGGGQTGATLARGLSGTLDTPAWQEAFPPLFDGTYQLSEPTRDYRYWHLTPIGRPGGRHLFALLSSYEFFPVSWNFYRPVAHLLALPYPMAIAVDIPKSHGRNEAISQVEGTVLASKVHLATSVAEDSRSSKKLADCHLTLRQLNDGDRLHEVGVVVAVAAPDHKALYRAVEDVINITRPYFLLRREVGPAQLEAVKYFSTVRSKHIQTPSTHWQMVSRELALLFAPLGFRKLSSLEGTLRGQSADGAYPFFFNSWGKEKKATHELWVGLTGAGKTFALNVNLTRQYIEEGIPFDLLEPMGHGGLLADALGIPHFQPSPQVTRLNPLDIMYPDLTEQVTHVIRILETLLGRQFAGTQLGNHQKSLIGQGLVRLYGKRDIQSLLAWQTPIIEDLCTVLRGLGDKPHVKGIADDLADEIAGLCTGAGPYAIFTNARTNLDLSFRGRQSPRVFSFDGMSSDPELLALAYTQVLSAIRRDSLADDTPRVIAVDEVYRLMRHPSLLDFLIEAVKTFRTRRKKVMVVDQQMMVFSEGKARLIFENCPIRVIFNQRSGIQVFHNDPAFSHLTAQHLEIIAGLQRGFFLLDIQEHGIFYLLNRVSTSELARFGSS